jgi:D-alanyl-D-alanine carboxypeptidase
VFASIVGTPSATLPVAGTVHNTNTLLGHKGFVGVKTGSTDAAGGCFAFQAIRWIDGKRTAITGVVLGQPGHNQIAAGLAAADAMVDRIASIYGIPPPTKPAADVRAADPNAVSPRLRRTAARPRLQARDTAERRDPPRAGLGRREQLWRRPGPRARPRGARAAEPRHAALQLRVVDLKAP